MDTLIYNTENIVQLLGDSSKFLLEHTSSTIPRRNLYLPNPGKTHPGMYDVLSSDHPIDLCRYKVANCYMGKIGLINSGGASSGESDFIEAAKTAVINKRAGGTGLIAGRKAFQRPMEEGIGM